jgi:RNA-directed DNA polymerase
MSSGIASPIVSTDLYGRVCDWSNLMAAAARAARGKRGRRPAATFEYRLADELVRLQRELRTFTYAPGPYTNFHIRELKLRLISAAPFRDRVVHHALCRTIEPLFERRFIAHSYANRVGKGTHRAINRCQELARRYRYVLPLDVRQHFPSVDHAILSAIIAKVVPDEDVLWLCRRILASGEGVLESEYDMVYFPGDDLWAVDRPRGLPIGNLTSQFWSNCYLDPFDHFVTRELRCPGYVRYVDDMLLFADDKAVLWDFKRAVLDRLAELRLTVHEDRAQVQPTSHGIPWLGFVVYPTHRQLKRRNVVCFRRHLNALVAAYQDGRITFAELDASIRGWIEHARHGDTSGLRRALLGSLRIEPVAGSRSNSTKRN